MMKRYLLATVSALTLTLFAGLAFAHAFPQKQTPGAGDTVQQAPAEVRILFDNPIEPAFSKLTIKNAHGDVVSHDSRVTGSNNKLLEADLSSSKPGQYHVYWHVVARDSHRTEGDYKFTVK